MAEARKQYPKILTPIGTARFAHLMEPDTEGKYADNKYKVDLIVDADDPAVEAIQAAMQQAAKDEWGKAPASLQLPIKDGDEEAAERERPELVGKVIIRGKSKYPPGIVGPDKRELADGIEIRSGDQIRFSATCFPYKAGVTKGVSLQLRAVQLVEKRAAVGNPADEFDDLEGYEAPASGGDMGDLDEQDF